MTLLTQLPWMKVKKLALIHLFLFLGHDKNDSSLEV